MQQKRIYNLSEPKILSGEPPPKHSLREGKPLPLVLSPSRAFGTRGTLSASDGQPTFQTPATVLSLGWLLHVKVDKKAMIRSRYNRVPHPTLNTKRERD